VAEDQVKVVESAMERFDRRLEAVRKLVLEVKRRGDIGPRIQVTEGESAQHFVIGAYRLDGKRLDILLLGQFEPAGSVRHVFSSMFVKKLRTDPAAQKP
jgi:hypothetical protein